MRTTLYLPPPLDPAPAPRLHLGLWQAQHLPCSCGPCHVVLVATSCLDTEAGCCLGETLAVHQGSVPLVQAQSMGGV